MFISTLDLFKIGIGPSSSHTMGPMVAAGDFRGRINTFLLTSEHKSSIEVRCTLKGSLAFTGKGHATDRAVALGLHGYTPRGLADQNVNLLIENIWKTNSILLKHNHSIKFRPDDDIIFDRGEPLPQHPNGMIFELTDEQRNIILTETYFSIGGGFIGMQVIFFSQMGDQWIATFDMAGCSCADRDHMLALRTQIEEMIESRHSIYLTGGHIQRFGNKNQGFFIQITERFLHGVQSLDQGIAAKTVAPHGCLHDFPPLVFGGGFNHSSL